MWKDILLYKDVGSPICVCVLALVSVVRLLFLCSFMPSSFHLSASSIRHNVSVLPLN